MNVRSLIKLQRCFFSSGKKLLMPAFSPTMETGKISSWVKKVGDKLEEGDEIAQIETDKATVALEADAVGFLAEIIVQAGDADVKVGVPIGAVVKTAAELKDYKPAGPSASASAPADSKAKEAPKSKAKEEPKPQAQAPAQAQPKKADSSAAKLPPHTLYLMPMLSPTMETGAIGVLDVKEGDQVKEGDRLGSVETDKSPMDLDISQDGFIAKLLVVPGQAGIPIGGPLAVIVKKKEDIAAFKNYSAPEKSKSQEAPSEPKETPQAESKTVEAPQNQASTEAKDGKRIASPLAKKIAQKLGIDISDSTLHGSGPGGRVLAHDVESHRPAEAKAATPGAQEAKNQASASAKSSTSGPVRVNHFEEVKASSMRTIVAKRLTESKQTIPHYYLEIEVKMAALLKMRKLVIEQSGKKVSVTDLLIKAVGAASSEVPEANWQLHGDSIKKFEDCDVSLAVDIGDGLITPIIRAANKKSLLQIAEESADLIARAKSRKLKPAEYQGGTIGLSNLGMMGVKNFAAVINPPQSSILAIGKTEKRPVFDEKAPNQFVWEDMMCVTLSADHRIIDGAVGAKWLQAFQKNIEKPFTLLL